MLRSFSAVSNMSAIFKVCLLLAVFVVTTSAVDQTKQFGAIGSEVVDAVVNLIRESCLFADDKRFLVRLAYVQSHDGHDAKTFRNGYHGGIWQVDKTMFDEIQHNSGRLSTEYSVIRNQFGIDWNTVTWSELRKPLYSGIAAALYTILHGGTQWRIEDQAHFYEQHFVNLAGNNFTNQAKILDQGCHGNDKLDLAFVVDRSNSLSSDDFLRAKYFMQNVVDSFDIAPNKTHIAVVSYSSNAKTEFRFNNYQTKSQVKDAISKMPFIGGSTATAAAINQATTDLFSSAHGSRSDAVKVMVVITDGDANDIIDTGHAADKAHKAGITVFSIGVGALVQRQTLNSIASNPDCTHVFSVANYNEIKAIKEEIQQSSCKAPVYIDSAFCCKIGECPTIAYNTKIGGVTLETNMSCGAGNVYTAFSNSNPSQSFYEQYGTVSSGTPGIMFVNTSIDRTLFINEVDALKNGGSGDCQICINPKDGNHLDHTVKCYQNGIKITCPDNCEEKWNLFPDVCTLENLQNNKMKFVHPFSKVKYLMCDKLGQLYVVHCPQNQSYYQSCEQCVGQGSSCPNQIGTALTGIVNPCSLENILKGNFFFTYPPDVTKFIHCDVWGKPWVMSCPSEEEWDQNTLTCLVIPPYNNPCRGRKDGDPLYYAYSCDPHKYIQCDLFHESFLMTCQLNFIFSPHAGNCVPKNSYIPPTRDPNINCPEFSVTHTHPQTTPAIVPGQVDPTGTSAFPTYTYCSSCRPYTAPCTTDHLLGGDLWFPVTGVRNKFIQCDLTGHMYLKSCPQGSYYFDDATNTCVDGPFQVDGNLGK